MPPGGRLNHEAYNVRTIYKQKLQTIRKYILYIISRKRALCPVLKRAELSYSVSNGEGVWGRGPGRRRPAAVGRKAQNPRRGWLKQPWPAPWSPEWPPPWPLPWPPHGHLRGHHRGQPPGHPLPGLFNQPLRGVCVLQPTLPRDFEKD